MEQLLLDIFHGSKPSYRQYPSFAFENMLNIGLVLTGVKPGGFTELDESVIKTLRKKGFYAQPYPLMPHLTFVSLKDPKFSPTVNHVEVGKALGYFTPMDIWSNRKRGYAEIRVTFKRVSGKSKPRMTSTLNQAVVGKTVAQTLKYLAPFVEGIKRLPIPKEFVLLSVEPVA